MDVQITEELLQKHRKERKELQGKYLLVYYVLQSNNETTYCSKYICLVFELWSYKVGL